MKKIILILLALLSLSSSYACEMLFKSEALCLETTWEVTPTRKTAGILVMAFTAQNDPGRLIDPKNSPFVQLWMPSMGHGSKPVTMTLIENGKYRVSNIVFIMGGPWDIRFQLKDGSQVIEELIQKINI